jgi:glutathione synthase
LQSTLWNAHGIKTVRRTLADVAALGKLDADGTLRIGNDLVSVVYFRAGCVL